MGEVPGKSSVALPCCFLTVRPLCYAGCRAGFQVWVVDRPEPGRQERPGNTGRAAWGSVRGTPHPPGQAGHLWWDRLSAAACPPHASCWGLHRADLCLGGVHGGPLSALLSVVCRELFEVCPGHCPTADSHLSHVLTSPCRLVAVPTSPAVPVAAGQAGPGVLSALAAGRGLLVALAKQACPGPISGFSALTPGPACPRDPHYPQFRWADWEPTAQARGLWLCRADSHGASRARPSPASPAAQAQARLCLPASVLQQRDACSPCPKRTSSRDESPVRRQPLAATPPPQPCSMAPPPGL